MPCEEFGAMTDMHFAGPIQLAEKVLHARLYCGLKFFRESVIDDSLDIPVCAVKWVCRMIGEEATQQERDFAATGNNRKGAKPASACKKCDQNFCPIWKTAHAG
jgi:hypothetical protein